MLIETDKRNWKVIPRQYLKMEQRKTMKTESHKSDLRKIRESLLISKSELARRAGVSVVTISRIEKGENCRLDTKRKVLLALGLKVENKDKVFRD